MLRPHQQVNVATLLTLLAALPDEQYTHACFGFDLDDMDKGCALGLAMQHAGSFKDEDGAAMGSPIGLFGPCHFSEVAFGPEAFDRVFSQYAYDKSCSFVTRGMVIDRLTGYAKAA